MLDVNSWKLLKERLNNITTFQYSWNIFHSNFFPIIIKFNMEKKIQY